MTNRTSILLQLILGRRVQECPGDEARLQQASRALLQGLSILLDQGEGCLTAGPGRVHSRGGAEAVLRRHQVSFHLLCSLMRWRLQQSSVLPEVPAAPEVSGGVHTEFVPTGAQSACESGGRVDSAGGQSPMFAAKGSGTGSAFSSEDPGLLPFTWVVCVLVLTH